MNMSKRTVWLVWSLTLLSTLQIGCRRTTSPVQCALSIPQAPDPVPTGFDWRPLANDWCAQLKACTYDTTGCVNTYLAATRTAIPSPLASGGTLEETATIDLQCEDSEEYQVNPSVCANPDTLFTVKGRVDFDAGNCDVLPTPDEVEVTVKVFNRQTGQNRTDVTTILLQPPNSGSQSGNFEVTVPWPLNQPFPDWWSVTSVLREADGGPLCTPDSCGPNPPLQCMDMASKVRRAPIDSQIEWRVGCMCMRRN